MKTECFTFGPLETNTYLLTADDGRHCAIVDAPPDSAQFLLPKIKAEGLVLDAVLLTHGHWDHMADAHAFAAPGVLFYAHKADATSYATPEKYMPFYRISMPALSRADFLPIKITNWLGDGDTFPLLGRTFEARHVPGHCPGNLLFYCEAEKAAFPGDAIFAGSVGRSDLPGGNWPELLNSIRTRIYTLPDDTVLWPGHGEDSTVGHEKLTNPYARPA